MISREYTPLARFGKTTLLTHARLMTALPRTPLIVVTRPSPQAEELVVQFKSRGFESLAMPTIALHACQLPHQHAAWIAQAAEGHPGQPFDWVVFTSANAVRFFRAALGEGARLAMGTKIAAQGRGSARVVKELLGRTPDLVPEQAVLESLLAALCARAIATRRVLVPGALEGRDLLVEGLARAGAQVCRVATYQTVPIPLPPRSLELLRSSPQGAVFYTFFSPSAFSSIRASVGDALLRAGAIVAIGPITAAAVRAAGLEVALECREHSEQGLVAELSDALALLSRKV